MKNKQEIRFKGTTLSEGIAIGKVFLYHDILTRDISSYSIGSKDVPYELKRISKAITAVKKDLYTLSRTVSHNVSAEDGNIFEAQRLMIEDEEFVYSFEHELRNEYINAEQVAKNVFRRQIARIENSSNEIIKAKADDLRDILRKMLRFLLGIETSILGKLPQNTIVVARRLLPSDTLKLDKNNIEGIIVQEGSIHAHSALLARSLGIPAFCTNGQPIKGILRGSTAIIDGYSNNLFVNPTDSSIQLYQEKKNDSALETKKKALIIKGLSKTKSGKTIRILSNANSLDEINFALESGCDGIGLFRTETLYLQSKTMPTEDDLYQSLMQSIKPIGNETLTIRLLDIGGDKRLPYFQFDEEFSPFLGLRGIRLLLKNPELLTCQLRVFLRLAKSHDLNVLIPMVSIPDEILEVRKMLKECGEDIGIKEKQNGIKLGSMIETPSSALSIEDIIKVSDFVSIGTNDLIQYIMAASRENPNVSYLYERGIEYVLPLVKKIVNICNKAKKKCSVCGEIINNEEYLQKFIECGVNQFSVSSFRIPFLKQYIKGLE
jgi:phosphoenolpyruvate-protein phosphotransferase